MNQVDNNARDVVEIDLGALFWAVAARWRRLLLCGLAFALLFGALRSAPLARRMLNPAAREAAAAEYQQQMESYAQEKAVLDARIERLSWEIRQMESYETKSQLFSIDPYHVSTEEIVCYVEPSAEKLLDSIVPSLDYSQRVVEAYCLAVNGISAADARILLPEAGEEQTPEQSDSSSAESANPAAVPGGLSLITCQIHSSGLFSIRAIGSDAGGAQALLTAAEEELYRVKPAIEEIVHDHTLSIITRNSYQNISDELILLHVNHEHRLNTLKSELQEAMEESADLKTPSPLAASPSGFAKSFVKNAVVGFLTGIVLAFLILAFSLMLKGRVNSADELAHRFQGEIVGVLSNSSRAGRLDRRIAKHRGLAAADADTECELAAANLSCVCRDCKSVLVAGAEGAEAVAAFIERAAREMPGVRLVSGGELSRSVQTVKELADSDALILVERMDHSAYSDIEREIQKIRRTGIKLLGFLVVGDMRP